jgi:uncharacterized protein YndB with AHSA1/START domain
METLDQSRLLPQLSRGTPCGELLRRWWHPMASTDELRDRVTSRGRTRCRARDEARYRRIDLPIGQRKKHVRGSFRAVVSPTHVRFSPVADVLGPVFAS